MAEKKKYKVTKSSSGKKTAPKKNGGQTKGAKTAKTAKTAEKAGSAKRTQERPEYREIGLGHRAAPFIIAAVTLFLAICMLFPDGCGFLGKWLRDLFSGLFSWGSMFMFPVLIILALFWQRDAREYGLGRRIGFGIGTILTASVLFAEFSKFNRTFAVAELYDNGRLGQGGGVLGGLLSALLGKAFGRPGVLIITIAALAICVVLLLGLTPAGIAEFIRSHTVDKVSDEKDPSEKKPRKPKPHTPSYDPTLEEAEKDGDEYEPVNFADGVDVYDDSRAGDIDPNPYETDGGVTAGQAEYDDIFGVFDDKDKIEEAPEVDPVPDIIPEEAEGLAAEREDLFPEKPAEEEAEVIPYEFPPKELLPLPRKAKNMDNSRELQSKGEKLVATLASFKVNTNIVHISQGPTITRYELVPEQGVRVKSIANLVDDISLALATQGVRIEAPIPGKAAVGVEVPNSTVSTVFLRELLENPDFTNSESLLTVALGMDVAGAPVYLDISRMPHLLIAGATGMGKSVCINSMIVSLLYRADPEQVKLILVDPKKVELSVYNGLPHLLVPVVTDPKKAAGTLRWAVLEMDRRFELIESVGARDIYRYNVATRNDPDCEFLPHVVIIIDELADLMMTAPDDIEDSIMRLAQKARAAGMHLIIGTQRPSVDIITGVIKGNIPSRIAFTVASQVDSRTILDTAGAEKLIGRGDMLYAPVGQSKPVRVQGAFVSEQDVERIVDYIKSNRERIEYDDSVIETIEEESKKCKVGKKRSAGESTLSSEELDDDPMLKPAIELALESGKISTSLIQRRLKLGYGRSAKLIDVMEAKGIVSPPDGQKPRSVLITKPEYQEMLAGESPDEPDDNGI